MTWGKVSDDLHSHPKWTQLSPNAKALWCTALSYCNAYLTNGAVTPEARGQLAVETFGYTPDAFELFDRAAAELVAVRAPESKTGMWKARRGGGWLFHQWDEHQPKAEDEKLRKMRNRRRHELHNTSEGRAIKAKVFDRDCGMCRYCGVVLDLGQPGGPGASITYEHVDPNGANSPGNVVLCCGRCNRRKSGRSLEESGMQLLDPGASPLIAAPVVNAVARTPPGSSRSRVGTGRVGTGRDGTGEVGTGEVGSGRVGDGSVTGDELTDAWLRAQYEQTIGEAS